MQLPGQECHLVQFINLVLKEAHQLAHAHAHVRLQTRVTIQQRIRLSVIPLHHR